MEIESPWKDPAVEMPPQGELVIVEFEGMWDHHGMGGLRDVYAWDGEWFNIPEGVTIRRWMLIPD